MKGRREGGREEVRGGIQWLLRQGKQIESC